MKQNITRLTALLLAVSMSLSLLCSSAWAAELPAEADAATVSEQAEPAAEEPPAEEPAAEEPPAEEPATEEPPAEEPAAEEPPAEEPAAEEPAVEEPAAEEPAAEEAVESQPTEAPLEEVTEELPTEETEELAPETVAGEEAAVSAAPETEIPAEAPAEELETMATPASGTIGSNLYWSMSESGVLTIWGSGAMNLPRSSEGTVLTPWYSYQVTSIVIAAGMTSIDAYAFWGCSNAVSVSIPNTVTSIGSHAFWCCNGLTSVTIPGSVKTIGSHAFWCCNGLTSVTLQSGVQSIGSYAFYNCDRLTSVTLQSGVQSIGSDAFSFCDGLTSINIPNSVTGIGADAFEACDNLTTVVIGNGVKVIGSWAFFSCDKLATVVVGSGVTTIGYAAFKYCPALKKVYFRGKAVNLPSGSIFDSTQAMTAYYPANGTWTAYRRHACDGTVSYYSSTKTYYYYSSSITWKTWTPTGITLATPAVPTLTNSAKGVTIKWGKVSGAAKYRIFRKTSTSNWTKLIDTTATSYTNVGVSSGVRYYYTIRCINSAGTAYTSEYNTSGSTIVRLAQPSVATANLSTGIRIRWGLVRGATGYRIYRKTSSTNWVLVRKSASATGAYMTDTTAKVNGQLYYYAVRAYYGNYMSSYNTAGTKSIRLTTTGTTSLTNTSGRKLNVKWTKNASASGYQVQYSSNKSFPANMTSTVTVSGASAVSKTVTAAATGRTYYVRVRSYKVIGSAKSYAQWSAARSVYVNV